MKPVTLKTYKDDEYLGETTAEISEGDVNLLKGYVGNINRLTTSKIIQNGLPLLRNINYKKDSGFSFEFSPYEMAEVYEALHLSRPLILAKEPFSFQKSIAMLGNRFEGKYFRSHLKAIRKLYEDGENRRYFNISVNGVSLFDNKTFCAWLNGVEYHQDPDKKDIVEMLNGALTEESARGFFVAHLTSRVTALYMLNNLAKLVIEKYQS